MEVTCLSSRLQPSTTTLSSRADGFPKSPNVDEIIDLSRLIEDVTDVLSCLLLKDVVWKKGLSSDERKLLDSSIEIFCTFCKDAKTLLQTFFNFSRQVAALYASTFDPECSPDIKSYASALQSTITSTFTQIASVEQHYGEFTSRFRGLIGISPFSVRTRAQALDMDHEVFERLDAFWKVVATQISSLLEGRSQLPHPEISHDLRNKWQEYQGHLIGAMDVLTRSPDALEGSVTMTGLEVQRRSLSIYVKRGFNAFWTKLTRRRSKSHIQNNGSAPVKRSSRFTIGSRVRRKLMIRVREQPINFMIIVHQSLMTAKSGQIQCRAGSKAVRILLGEANEDPEEDRAKFVVKTLEDIKKSASDLNQDTNGIMDKFRLLRNVVLDLRKDLQNKVTGGEERSSFLARLTRFLNKDVGNCDLVLRKVHDDLEGIENSLNLITRWWQKVESDADYLQINGGSLLAILRNRVTLKSIGDSFMTLEKDLADYLDKMTLLFDENIIYLNDKSKKHVMEVRDCANLKISQEGRLEPGSK